MGEEGRGSGRGEERGEERGEGEGRGRGERGGKGERGGVRGSLTGSWCSMRNARCLLDAQTWVFTNLPRQYQFSAYKPYDLLDTSLCEIQFLLYHLTVCVTRSQLA